MHVDFSSGVTGLGEGMLSRSESALRCLFMGVGFLNTSGRGLCDQYGVAQDSKLDLCKLGVFLSISFPAPSFAASLAVDSTSFELTWLSGLRWSSCSSSVNNAAIAMRTEYKTNITSS